MNRIIPLISTALIFFLLGYYSYSNKTFPYSYVREAYGQLKVIKEMLGLSKPHHLYRAVYESYGANVVNASEIMPGSTLVTSYWRDLGWKAGIKLINRDGKILHTWNADPTKIWKSNLQARMLNFVHGTYLFPNGDILFNIEFMGLVRMDSCGNIKWVLDYSTHHSISRNDKGDFWVSGNTLQNDPSYIENYTGLESPIYEDHALLVSPEGQILKDINILKVIYDNELQRYLPKISNRKHGDIFHLNDIEELSVKVANQYPHFQAGDLLISLKFMHLVLVMNPETKKVKWYTSDPIIEQHDPDFIGDGWIGIFDNNSDYARGKMLGGSRILAINPQSMETKVLYKGSADRSFYTETGGKWQILENSNMLIVEARAGRVFEVDRYGNIVWEWIHDRYNKSLIPEVLEATRYPYTEQQINKWSCSQN